jgi:hypothetical protein
VREVVIATPFDVTVQAGSKCSVMPNPDAQYISSMFSSWDGAGHDIARAISDQ